MPVISICANFDLFPDNTILGASFRHSNFSFRSKSGIPLFINNGGGEKGLTILPPGIIVDLVTPVNVVYFRVGIWDGNDIMVTAKDKSGGIISQKIISIRNTYIDSYIKGDLISSIEFDSNGKEELLVSICIDITIP